MLKISIIFLILESLTAVTWAQEIRYQYESEVLVEDAVVPSGLTDSAVKTEVISKKKIQENHYKNAADVINQVPGVQLSQNDRRAGQSAVVQGLDRDRVLVLIDGVRQEQTSSYGFDLSQIPADDIERVEIVKGASSALYGSQAMGGVIHIITKRPTEKLRTSLEMESGQYSAINGDNGPSSQISASVSGKKSGVGHRTQLSYRGQSAIDRNNQTFSQDLGEAQKINASVYLDKTSGKTSLTGQYRYFNEELESVAGVPSPSTGTEKRLNSTSMQNHKVTLGVGYQLAEANDLKSTISYESVQDKLNLLDKPTTAFKELESSSDFVTTRWELQWNKLAFENHLLSSGVAVSRSTLDSGSRSANASGDITETNSVDNKSNTTWEVFAQDDIVTDKWELVPGFRVQSDSSFGSHFSPKLSSKYHFEKASLLASVGTGYRTPSLKERFYYLDHSSFGYIAVGNENLRPESSISYQLGAELNASTDNKLYGNLFYNDVSDFIATQVESGGAVDIHRYSNISDATITGMELQWTNSGLSWLQSELSHTFIDARIDSNQKKLPLRPESISRISFKFLPQNKLNFISTYKYVGQQFTDEANLQSTPAYGTLDLRLNYNYQKQNSFYFGIDNALNETRPAAADVTEAVSDQRPAVGTYYYLGVQFRG